MYTSLKFVPVDTNPEPQVPAMLFYVLCLLFAPVLFGQAQSNEWARAESLKIARYQNLVVIDSGALEGGQLPAWARIVSVDPSGKRAFVYIDPGAMHRFVSDARYRDSKRASPYDFLNSIQGKTDSINRQFNVYMMTPLTPVQIAIGTGLVGDVVVGGGTAPKPNPLPRPPLINRVAIFLDKKYSGKGRIIAYPQDQISVRRKVVGMKDEVLRGSGLWEELDIFITVVPMGKTEMDLSPVVDLSCASGHGEPAESAYAPADGSKSGQIEQYGNALMAELQSYLNKP